LKEEDGGKRKREMKGVPRAKGLRGKSERFDFLVFPTEDRQRGGEKAWGDAPAQKAEPLFWVSVSKRWRENGGGGITTQHMGKARIAGDSGMVAKHTTFTLLRCHGALSKLDNGGVTGTRGGGGRRKGRNKKKTGWGGRKIQAIGCLISNEDMARRGEKPVPSGRTGGKGRPA